MKRMTIALAFLITGISYAYSQDDPSSSGYKSLEGKLEKSNIQIADPKKKDLPKTWFERAKLFQDIADVNVQYLHATMSLLEIKLIFKEPKEIKKENNLEQYVYNNLTLTLENNTLKSWKETKTIVSSPLDSAYKCYLKTLELDKEGKMDKKVGEGLKSLKMIYQKEGLNEYVLQNLKGSFEAFKSIVSINQLKQVNMTDTAIIYYAGVTGFETGQKDEALKYLLKAKNLNYQDPNVYVYLKNAYLGKGDSANCLLVLKEGFTKYPTNPAILVELINYYLVSGESKAALEYLAKAKENDPKNKSYLFAEGTLYDKMSNPDKSIESYQKAIVLDSLYFDAYFNLGVVYYNLAVKKTEEANDEKDTEKYKAKKLIADEEFKKAIPYMEKAHAINPKDKQPLETLKTLYYRLKMQEQLDKVMKELKELQG